MSRTISNPPRHNIMSRLSRHRLQGSSSGLPAAARPTPQTAETDPSTEATHLYCALSPHCSTLFFFLLRIRPSRRSLDPRSLDLLAHEGPPLLACPFLTGPDLDSFRLHSTSGPVGNSTRKTVRKAMTPPIDTKTPVA